MRPFISKSFPIALWLLLGVVVSACVHQPKVLPQQIGALPMEKITISIAAIGDIMMPLSIQQAVLQHPRNYAILFDKISQDLTQADLVFGNLETPIDHTAPISGYPTFNSRPELLSALKKSGVGIVSLANNHALDKKPSGLKRTIESVEKSGLRFVGAGRTRSEAEQPTLLDIRGVKTAFLAYTYSTNGAMSRKKQDAPRVNILRTDSEDDLAIAMTAVRKVRGIADLVLVSLHWGEEYTTISSRWQRRVAGELIEAGADVILGHHPHVLQPIEFHTSRNGRQGIIAFSLGNFIASQNYGITSENMAESRALRGDGTIFTIFACKETGKTTIIRAEFIPTWMLYDRVGNIMVNRPVNLAREIKRLEDSLNRTEAEESTLQLLTYRKKSISAQLLQKQAP